MIWTADFWRDTAERAIRSAAQGFLTGTGLSMLATGVNEQGVGMVLIDVPWLLGLQTALGMVVFTVVTAIAAPAATRRTEIVAPIHIDDEPEVVLDPPADPDDDLEAMVTATRAVE